MAGKKLKKSNLFAALGAATGLGNAFRFPHLTSVYGCSFLIAYALCLALVCFPVLCAELECSRRGGLPEFLKRAAAVNSLVISLFYVLISSKLTLSAVSYAVFARENLGLYFTVVAVLLVLALCYFLLKRDKSASSGRASVVCFFALFLYLTVRGGFKITLPFGNIFSGSMWVDALGQSFLSLSLAAGVMPAFAQKLNKNFSAPRVAAKIIFVNLSGCVLSALGTLPFSDGGEGAGLEYAFTVYPRIISALAGTEFNARLTGAFIFGALAVVAIHSTCSLAYPAVSGLKLPPVIFCAAAALLCPLFAYNGGEALSACDKMTCSVVAVCIAFGECVGFAFYQKSAFKRIYTAVIGLILAVFCVLSLCSIRFSVYSLPSAACAFLCLSAIPCAILYADDFKKFRRFTVDKVKAAYYNKNSCDRN